LIFRHAFSGKVLGHAEIYKNAFFILFACFKLFLMIFDDFTDFYEVINAGAYGFQSFL
jgi:hypothetical protein